MKPYPADQPVRRKVIEDGRFYHVSKRKVIKNGQMHHVDERWLRANAVRKKNPYRSCETRTAHQLFQQGEILKEVKQILAQFDIPMVLSDGAVLGIVRHGDFVPWDFDTDIFVLYDQVKDIGLDLAAAFIKAGYQNYKFKSDPHNWKLAVVKDGCLVELRAWLVRGDEYVRYERGAGKSIFTIPCWFFDYLVEAELRGGTYLIPLEQDEYLTHNYGDWRTPIQSSKAQEYFAKTYMRKQ